MPAVLAYSAWIRGPRAAFFGRTGRDGARSGLLLDYKANQLKTLGKQPENADPLRNGWFGGVTYPTEGPAAVQRFVFPMLALRCCLGCPTNGSWALVQPSIESVPGGASPATHPKIRADSAHQESASDLAYGRDTPIHRSRSVVPADRRTNESNYGREASMHRPGDEELSLDREIAAGCLRRDLSEECTFDADGVGWLKSHKAPLNGCNDLLHERANGVNPPICGCRGEDG